MPEPQTSYANGNFSTAVSLAGSNNVAPIMSDTLGTIFLAIISLILLFELHRSNDLNRKLLSRGCDGSCSCNCHKQSQAGNS